MLHAPKSLTALLGLLLLTARTLQAEDTLPDPDGKPADMSKPVQVYILLGQSNMLGFGKINPAKGNPEGSLTHAVKEKELISSSFVRTSTHPTRSSSVP